MSESSRLCLRANICFCCLMRSDTARLQALAP
nr:MAG TPA: hypothetical protein [Caudoviricetes sp.]